MWCKALEESTYVDPQFIQFSKRFTMAKVNADVDTSTAARYRVLGYPTIMVLNEKGEELDRVVGYYRAPEFMSQVEDYIAGRNTLASMVAEDHGLFDDSKKRFLVFVTLDPKNGSSYVDDAYYRLARMARKEHDYANDRKYAQIILDRYPDSDMMKPAFLEVGINLKKSGSLPEARHVFLDYAKRFPDDEDAPWAREQADTIAAQLRRPPGS